MALHSLVSDALSTSFDKASATLQRTLQEQALQAGWSPEAALSIKVEHGDGAFKASHGDEAYDYEYGTMAAPPMSVVRTFNLKQHERADALVMSHLEHSLRGLL